MIDKIRLFLSLKTTKNGIWLYFLQFFNMVAPLCVLPYVTNSIGVYGFGEFSLALNVFTYLQVFIEYGFNMTATRKLTLINAKSRRRLVLFSSIVYSRFIFFCISIIILYIYILTYSPTDDIKRILFVLLFGLIGSMFQVNWIFQALEEMRYISIIGIVSRIVSIILIFCFVKTPKDVFFYSLCYIITPLLVGFLGIYTVLRKYDFRLVRVSFYDLITEIKDGFYVFVTQLSGAIFSSIGITFLSFFNSTTELGIFALIQKIPAVILLLWNPVAQVLYPMSCKNMAVSFAFGIENVKKWMLIVLPSMAIVAIFIAWLSDRVLLLFLDSNTISNTCIYPLLIWMVVSIANNLLGIQVLVAGGFHKEYSVCFQLSTIFALLINYLLIKFFGLNGAINAPLISETFLAVCMIYEINKINKIKNKVR